MCDLFAAERLKEKLENYKKAKSVYFANQDDDRADINKIFDDLMNIAPQLRPLMTNVSLDLMNHIKAGKSILFEGAQGAMLDIDLGTYPFLTSSNTTVGGALTGLGLGPKVFDEIIGVVKAYTTRVGAGPFPTELTDEKAAVLRETGGEFGATTGRPRRVGWLDMVALRHACRINGVEKIAITKLDVLDNLEKIKVCEAYRLDGEEINEVPLDLWDLCRVTPVYREFKGWKEPTAGIDSFENLPAGARDYINYISANLGAEICLISTGARREETIMAQS